MTGSPLVGVYPGTFDPVTYGHLDLIKRGSKICGKLIVAVAVHTGKDEIFSAEERLNLIVEVLREQHMTAEVEIFDGLLVDFLRKRNAKLILRGVRAFTDFEYEFQMAMMNRRMAPEFETVFLMPNENFSFVSSRLVKQIAVLGGSVRDIVPPLVDRRLREKMAHK